MIEKTRRQRNWLGIETEYRGTQTPVLQIAKQHGISEGAIRKRAKKEGWVRDSGQLKRALVESKLAGITNASTRYEVRTLIEESAEQDAADMRDGLLVARTSIKKLLVMVELCEEPKNVKIILEANKVAIETIRRVRGLDVEVGQPGESWEDLLRQMEGSNCPNS